MVSEETSGEPESKSLKPIAIRALVNLTLLCVVGLIGYNIWRICQTKQLDYEARLAEVREARLLNHRLANENRQLKLLVEHLKTYEGVEEIAREKLGLVRSGETAFIVSPAAPERAMYTIVEPEPLPDPEPTLIQGILHQMFAQRSSRV